MSQTKLIRKHKVGLWLIRLTFTGAKYLVNSYSPKGSLSSWQFPSLEEANDFFERLCKHIRALTKQ